MARLTKTDHVKKICHCARWKECTHPWYVDYREGERKSGRVLRRKLATLVGREPLDFADAKAEARRAIIAWKDGRDARDLIPGDAPTLAMIIDSYGKRSDGAPIVYQRGPLTKTVVNGRPFGSGARWRSRAR